MHIIFRKTNFSYSLIRTRACEYQVVKTISFSGKLTYELNELLLKHIWKNVNGIRNKYALLSFNVSRTLSPVFGYNHGIMLPICISQYSTKKQVILAKIGYQQKRYNYWQSRCCSICGVKFHELLLNLNTFLLPDYLNGNPCIRWPIWILLWESL